MNLKILLILLILLISISGCVQNPLIEDFTFNNENGSCGSGESTAEMRLSDNKITFSGYAITSTPCYKLNASYSSGKIKPEKGPETDVITITITKEGIEGACIQCIGKIPFNGEITVNKEIWQKGDYGIEIIYEGKELARIYNYVV
jgi:hypothetical protein